ncbi:MAG: acyl carrier protein [Christensenellaceae bacterium]|jgi:acyl carrier protein|nr:acyl carrier protein [Christensenellaceae bacterium]
MEKIIKILKELHPEIDFNKEEHLIDHAKLDSLDIVTLVGELSDEFDIEIPQSELVPENFNSAKALLAMVERLGG